ncbi:hypothetical protein MWH28_11860 [Natroniella sulfidigena]|uniref:hypothetical protein n=1 Tax=Natroniella sulfidigena TaxID=723921 RepID=UPI00200B1577|nr:hypothetical protein [Natroniella sulfidigena]MCK8818053.1 hypothetical protein [Natroniella sulfidigena]
MVKRRFIAISIGLLFLLTAASSVASANLNIAVESQGSIVRVMDDIQILQEDVVQDVVAIMGDIKVNNLIRGDVISVLGGINQGPNSQIYGDITEISRFDGRIIRRFNIPFLGWSFRIFRLIIYYGLAVLIISLLPEQEQEMAKSLADYPLRKLLIGFVSLLALPIIILIAGLSLIGIPLIPFIILAFMIVKFIGYIAVALFIGQRIKEVGQFDLNLFLELLLGITILGLVRFIPLLGGLSYLIVALFALGVVFDTKFGTNKPWFKKIEKINDLKDD